MVSGFPDYYTSKPLPVTTKTECGATSVPHATMTPLVTITGKGRMMRLLVYVNSISSDIRLYIYVDGVSVDLFTNNAYDVESLTEHPARVFIDTVNTRTFFIINVPYSFNIKIEIKAFQGTGVNVNYLVLPLLCEMFA